MADEFVDARGHAIAAGFYRRLRDRHTLYTLKGSGNSSTPVGLRANCPVWYAECFSVTPPRYDEIEVSPAMAKSFVPESPDRVQSLLAEACKALVTVSEAVEEVRVAADRALRRVRRK